MKRAIWLLAACGSSGSQPHDAPPMIDASPDAPPDVAIDAPKVMGDGPDVGFDLPKAALRANMRVSGGNWMDVGPADLSCLGTASGDQATTVTVTAAAVVKDFQSG